jgi:hypothetical protein
LSANRKHSGNGFDLEALEPRVLLSADALAASSVLAGATQHHLRDTFAPIHEHSAAGLGTVHDASYNPSGQAENMFEEVTGEAVQSPAQTPAQEAVQAAVIIAPKEAVSPAAAVQQSASVAAQAHTQTATSSSAGSSKISSAATTTAATVSAASGNVLTQQLTQTLTAANGPPASQSIANTAIYQANLAPPDMTSSINAELALYQNGTASGTVVLNFGNLSLGGVLSLTNVSLTFNAVYAGGNFSGSVTVHADAASLTLGSAVTSTINDINGTFSLPGKTYSLTLGSSDFAISSFVFVHANSAAITYDPNAATTVTITNGATTSTKSVSTLTIGATGVTIFAGLNGPASNSGATGLSLTNANLALALFKPVIGSDTSFYYGLKASADSLAPVGLPTGVDVGATDIAVEVNSSFDGSHVVDFTKLAGGKLTVPTGGTTFEDLDFDGAILKVAATVNLDFTDFIHINGSFSFTKTSSQVTIVAGQAAFDGASDVTFKLGSASDPFLSATGSVSLKFDAVNFSILSASLTVNGTFTLASVVEVDTPSISVTNLTINKATGEITGVVDGDGTIHDPTLSITAVSASLFPGNSTLTATVSATGGGDGLGFQGTFNLRTFAFSITLEEFHLAVGSIFTADASGVIITYDPSSSDPHQQLVEIGSGTVAFGSFGLSGTLTNLTIYKDGFHFDSFTVSYAGDITLGSILTITDPSITLTDFGATFTGDNAGFAANGSIILAAASLKISVGSAEFNGTGLSISFNLASDHFGETTITAGTLEFQFGSYVTIQAEDVNINTNPADGHAYLTVGSASATLSVGSLSVTGTATDFSIINSGGSAEFEAGDNFTVLFTATSTQLHLPSWLGFQIQKLAIFWPHFNSDPTDFILVLSASVTSIQGLPGGVTVSGSITNAVIDFGKLASGEFPITSIQSFSGGIEGNLFGLHITASFVFGIISLNSDNQIVNVADGTVTDPTTGTTTPGGNLTVVGSVIYVGVSGGAEIPGVGGVQIYLGFSSLGPLTVFLKAEFPLILEPVSGIAIGGFEAGVDFNLTLPTPGSPFDLRNAAYGSPGTLTASQWQNRLQQQTVTQYLAVQNGTGNDNTAAYSQPMVIRAGVTFYDAYLSQDAFKIEGTIAIGIDPSNPNKVAILLTGTATFGDSVNFKAYAFIGLTISGSTTTAQLTFLFDEPADTPVESFGGTLLFGFTDAAGHPLTSPPPAISVTTTTSTTSTGATYTATEFTPPNQVDGFYISFDGVAQFSAFGTLTLSITGSVTLTVTSTFAKIDLSGTLSVTYLGDLAQASGQLVVDYSTFDSHDLSTLKIYGALKISTGSGISKLENIGLYVDGAATFQLNTTGQQQTVYLPDPGDPHNPDAATEFVISGETIFDVTIAGINPGTFATVEYKVNGDTVFTMAGDFNLRITANGLSIFADIDSLSIGESSSPFLTLHGIGLFIVNDQGIAAELSMTLNGGTTGSFGNGLTISGNFTMVMNTTSTDITYTVPDDLPAVSVYDSNGNKTGETRSLTIPRGPPQGLLLSNGTFDTIGAAGPYIVITGSGTLGITLGSLDALSLQGFFRFELSSSSAGPVVSLIVSMTGDVGTFASVSVTGALQITNDGVVALLNLGVGGGAVTNYGDGVVLTASFELVINSTATDVSSIGGIDLGTTITADTYKVVGSGTLALSVGGTGFIITGTILTTLNGTKTTIAVSGTLTATVAGQTLLTMTANGVLVVETDPTKHPGVAGELTLTFSVGNVFSGTGFNFNGSFDLQLNTTLTVQVVDVGSSTATITAGPNSSSTGAIYVQVHANGKLYFGTTDNNFYLNGDFYLAISTDGLAVSTSVQLGITVGGTSLFSFDASGAFLIASDGIALTLSLSVSEDFTGPSSNGSSFGFSMGGTFTLTVNTTGRNITIGSVNISANATGLPAGPYFMVSVPDAHITIGSATNGFNLSCNFTLTISSQGLAISGSGSLSLKVGGVSLFSFSADGGLLITANGIAAKMELTISAGGSGNSFAFDGAVNFVLEINTTSTAVTTINSLAVNLPAGPYFKVSASGHLTIATIVNISGSFTLEIGTGGIELTLNATANIFGVVFTLNGAAGIYSDGIVINFALGIAGGGTAASFLSGVITIDAQFLLQINSTGTAHLGVGANQQFKLAIHGSSGSGDAKVYVLGFLLTGQLEVSIVSGKFSATGTIHFDFFGFVNLTVAFHFDSSGNYYFYGEFGVRLGSSDWNIHGNLVVAISNMSATFSYTNADGVTSTKSVSPGFRMHVEGGVTAFGYDFASIGADVEINGTSVDISAYVSIDFYFFSIGGTVHIHLGSLATAPTPPPPVIAQVLPGGVLQLNLGTDASSRGVDALADEDYEISLISINGDGSENLSVYAPGVYGQPLTYNNVTSILVNNTSTSNTTIQIAGNIVVPVVIHAGSGKNQFIMGGGHATINGSTGNDKVIGGTGGVTFHAGTGTSIFVVGSGNNTLVDPGSVSVVASGYHNYTLSDTLLTCDGFTTSLTGTFLVTLTAASTGAASFAISNYSHTVTIDGNGNSSATASVTLDASLTLDGSVITESNGGIITLQNIPALQLYGGSSANTFTINSWSGSAPLLLDGKDAGDTYKINFVGSGTYTVNVSDSGASGTDSLIVNGTNSADTLNVSSNAITRASETVNYSGVENITLNTFGGNDTVNITSPSAAITINGGNGTDTFNVNSMSNPLTINTGAGANTINVPTMNTIHALLSVNGGGTDTLNLDDTADNTPNSGTLGSTTLTGFFGSGGSMNYSGIETMNLNLGNGGNTLTISGRSGITNISTGSGADTINVLAVGGTTNINAGAGPNTFNVGSLVFNNGSGVLDGVQGTINYTGSGSDTMNVDDSGTSTAETGTLRPGSLKFFDPLTINFSGVTSINIALSQTGDIFAVVDTITSSSSSPVVIIYANAGDDIITILDTHAVMTVNAGEDNDNIYVFGNSSVLNLNGDAGDDTFYIFASLHENTSNVDPGAAGPVGNTIYSYRNNAPVNIDGGSGHDRVFIFGTVLNDIITINGTNVVGAGLNVTFTNIEELIVCGLGGDDVFYVLNIAVPTTLIGDGSLPTSPPVPPDVTLPDLTGGAVATSWNDTFYIGWMGQSYIPGHLSTIQSTLTIEGDEGTDTAYVDDSGATANTSFILDATSLWSSSMGADGIIYYDNTVDNLNIKAGAGDDTITINGNATGLQTTIYGGPGNDHFIINDDPLEAPLAIVGDSNTFFGDTLTLNGEPGGNNFVITGFTIDGAGATISYATVETLIINGTGGTNTFTVNGTSIPTYINGASGSDTFIINGNSVPLYLDGAAGDDTFTINGNSGPLAATGDAGNDTFTVNGNSSGLTLSGGDDNDSFTINGSSSGSVLSANGGAGNDTFIINALSSPATLNGGANDDSFTVNAPLASSPMIIGGGGTDSLTVNGTVGNDFWVITNSFVGGIGSPVNYSDLDFLIVNGISGNDTFNVRSTSAATILDTGTGFNTINVGSIAPVTGGILDGIQGALAIVGNGNDILNIDDTGSVTGKTGTLTSSNLTGLGMGAGGITFSGVSILNLGLGSGNDTLTIAGTPSVPTNVNGNNGNDTFNIQATTGVTNLNGGAGDDTFNLGSLAPGTGGNVNAITGDLNIEGGSGTNVLNVDDTGDLAANMGIVGIGRLVGLGLGSGVNYSKIQTLNINLGSGNDIFNISSSNAITVTTVNAGPGTDTINVGSNAPASGGTLSYIFGALVIVGDGNDTLNMDDTGDATGNSGVLTPTTITGLGMSDDGITYSDLAALNISLGSGDDTFAVNDMTNATVTTINGGAGTDSAALYFSGNFAAQNLTLLSFETATLDVVGNFTGLLNDDGAITTAVIGGSFTSTGILNAGSIDTMTVGGDFAGLLNVTGLLNSLDIGGGSPGKIVAGSVNFITVHAGYGNKVLQVIEGGVERQIQALPVAGGTLPDTVLFTFIYDSSAPGNPQVAIQITNNGIVTPRSFDLVLACFRSNAKFNLALVFANGQTGVSNITVFGDILAKLSSAELNFFGFPPTKRGGVNLPSDKITGVEVSGNLTIGRINVAGIEGLAFAVLTTAAGAPVNILGDLGSTGDPQVLWNLLGSKPVLLPAVDVLRVPFNETHAVRLYAQSNTNPNLEYVMTLTDQIADKAPITALVQVQPLAAASGNPKIQSVSLVGDGGSLDTVFSLANLTSTGPLGSIIVRGSAGLGNVTAPNIFGNINTVSGGITGIIQTTGIRIDPITGAETTVSADLGKLKNGSVSSISAKLAISGKIISRGDLISSVTTSGAFTGVIAAQGNIGAILRNSSGNAVTTAGKLTRFGGIAVAGNDTGQIIALGNIFSDVTINGQLTGRIAAQGAAVQGVAATRIGILGSTRVQSTFSATAAVVSGGAIGDAAGGTNFSCGTANGFLAANGIIKIAPSVVVSASKVFQNSQSNANGAVINAVFTDGSAALQIESGLAGLVELGLIQTDLGAIHNSGGSLTGTTP